MAVTTPWQNTENTLHTLKEVDQPWIPTYGCGCYNGEGYYPLSPLWDLSPCFLGALTAVVSIVTVVWVIVDIYKLRFRKNLSATTPVWLSLKLGIIVLQIIFQISLSVYTAQTAKYVTDGVWFIMDIQWWATVTQLAAFIVSLPLSYIENYKTYVSSSSLIIFWALSALIGFFRTINVGIRHTPAFQVFLIVATTIIDAMVWLLEVSTGPKPLSTVKVTAAPADYANIFSKLTFAWLSPLMAKGYNKYLELKDLPDLPEELEAANLSKVLERNWNKQSHGNKKPSLVKALAASFGKQYAMAGFFKMTQDCIAFTQPQLLKKLILFVNDYSKDPTIPLTHGFMIVLTMFGLSIVQTGVLHQYFQTGFDTGIKVKSSLNSLIYGKSLVLSVEAKQKKSTGDIVNLMSVDTQRLQDTCQNLHLVWSGPFQVLLCLTSLYKLIGNAMWVGVGILLITIPLQTLLLNFQRALQKRQMKIKDKRTSLTSEMLNNIKSLKLYAWEDPYKAQISHVRNDLELGNLKRYGRFLAFNQLVFSSVPHFVSTATFALFLWKYPSKPLGTEIVFTALSLFNLLGFPLAVIPWVIGNIVESQISVTRLTDFLTSDELNTTAIHRLPPTDKPHAACVEIDDADFLWTREPYKVALVNISYLAKMNELNCIVGRVGAGKSSLLQSLLGDLHKPKGIAMTKGSIAYVPQVPWIMNGTIKENILFGCVYDPVFYQQTLKACALMADLAVLPDGDMTQVGEKGISMSGGQKARISLARAVYARADIYLMDDILSAVDEHVGKHIINNVLGPDGLLRSRCRILSTNSLPVLEYANQITMLADGRIVEQDSYDKLMGGDHDSRLYRMLNDFKSDAHEEPEETKEEDFIEKINSKTSEVSLSGDLDDEIKQASDKGITKPEMEDFVTSVQEKENSEEAAGRSEKHEQGKVKWGVYWTYFHACGIRNVTVMVLFVVLWMLFSVLANVWLKHWSDINSKAQANPDKWHNLAIYFGLCMASVISLLFQSLSQWLLCSISGSRVLHQGMLDCVMRAPMEFFETTPIGRILNRFSNDVYKIDENLFRVITSFLSNTIKVGFTLIIIVGSTWQFIFFIIPLGFIYKYYQKYYLASSRELRRLDSVSRSPIFAHFQETLSGVATIRAYNQMDRFTFLNRHNTDNNMRAYHPSVSANRWLAVRLEFIGSIIILGSSGLLIMTLRSGHVTPGLVGLSVSYALQVTQSLNWIVRMTVDIESNIVSVERVLEYSRLKPEAPEIIESHRPTPNWPENGAICFNDYSTRYRAELDLVLKNITLAIQKQEKIGIVGRTGAGKSSLTLAIFRIIEAADGHITIDGVNTSEIGLFDLRSKLSIIPQDSQIFQGTIRSNLDPTNRYSDEDLWNALKLSHLEKHVKRIYEELEDKSTVDYNALNSPVAEGGSNLSVGQRQLMCLARALCKKDCKILVLDEATANVDVQTDAIVQETIRSAFQDRTILTIAHRLNTIIDSDRIIFLDKGRIAEFDTPAKLLAKKDSAFYSLCKEGGIIRED